MSDFNELIDKYFESLNETDGERRRALIEQVWAEDGAFVSPFAEATGHRAIEAKVRTAQEQLPEGTAVRRTSDVEMLYNNFRFGFEAQKDGAAFIGGVDFSVVADGKLKLIVGFFDFAPNPAEQ